MARRICGEYERNDRAACGESSRQDTLPGQMNADTICNRVHDAIRMYGRYQFEDKGAAHVMDVGEIAARLAPMSAADARRILAEVAANDEPLCAMLASEVILELQDQPDAWFNALLRAPILSRLY